MEGDVTHRKSTMAGWRVAVAGVLVAGIGVADARAQQVASSLDALPFVLKPGELIEVTDTSGRRRTAEFAGVEGTSLRIRTGPIETTMAEADLSLVLHRHADSLANGALIGAGVGVGLMLPALGGCEGACAVGMVYLAAMGAGLGALIDWPLKSWRPVYVRTQAPASGLAVAPMLAPGRRGVTVRWSF
jgi:hypothetical protein